jgi:putative ABC transport system permease protein
MFAALVIATLTLGIGASTSMFSVVNGVLLKALPYRDPARLVWMYGSFRGSDSASVSPPTSWTIATVTRSSSGSARWRSARRA